MPKARAAVRAQFNRHNMASTQRNNTKADSFGESIKKVADQAWNAAADIAAEATAEASASPASAPAPSLGR